MMAPEAPMAKAAVRTAIASNPRHKFLMGVNDNPISSRCRMKRHRNGGREKRAESKLVLALGVEKLEGAVVIGFWHEDLGGTAQIAVVRRGGVHERLRGGDAMFLQHHHKHLGVHDRAGVKQFHAGNLAANGVHSQRRQASIDFSRYSLTRGIVIPTSFP